MRCDTLWTGARLATLAGSNLGIIENGVVAARHGHIVYAGPGEDAPRFDAVSTVPCDSRWITPGLIDCHTHLVHAGDRAHEFELRLAGASYEEIARAAARISRRSGRLHRSGLHTHDPSSGRTGAGNGG